MFNRLFPMVLIAGLPLSVAGSLFHWPEALMFMIYCATIIALAAYMGRATENLSIVSGPRIGGLLNATFGNAVELIISIFALKAGFVSIVLASLTGAVLGNLLLVGGLAFLVGGFRFKRQRFDIHDARFNAVLLMFGVVVAFVFPEIFSMYLTDQEALTLSVWIAVILILLYFAALLFRLVTHRGMYQSGKEEEKHEETAEWSKRKSIMILALSTIAVAYISESLVHTFESVGETFGWSDVFIGVIIVAIVGNAAEHASAIIMAYKNRMDVAVEIAIGSTLQIAMFVTPLLVLISLFFPSPMPLVFTVPELVTMVLAVLLTNTIAIDGDTNWFEGAMMLGAYLIMGVGFYLL
ncbi:Ca2+:H+ antiporter [Caldalkalibacillus uzonensis]|uniref:Ca(2+)/H(+) antiporter n=1 Tax=Caldalkalibacillus uzonensis TaxID=353224 RepID=A0ABU0CTW1_9BACI|nr:calcium/proton exchanger [Caldalkalibacillus uzonensis]MDQ0339779.1 Ca2+:H+ antiporter [Caldalkalibacillus uzonensis]